MISLLVSVLAALVSALVSFLTLAFTCWMLVECITPESAMGNERLIWVLVILFLPVLGPFALLRGAPAGTHPSLWTLKHAT